LEAEELRQPTIGAAFRYFAGKEGLEANFESKPAV
jgi:hypothetical protein